MGRVYSQTMDAKRQRAIHAGTWEGRRSIEDVRPHLVKLIKRGMSRKRIGRAAHVDERTVGRILRRGQQLVNAPTAAALLAVPVPKRPPAPRGMVDATGAMRRTRAAGQAGYSLKRMAAEIGGNLQNVWKIQQGRHRWIEPATDRAITAMYKRLPFPCPDPDRRTLAAIQARVQRGEVWHPWVAWDDDTIGDPDAEPAYDAPRPRRTDVLPSQVKLGIAGVEPFDSLTTAEAIEVCTVLISWGWTHERIGEHLQWGTDAEKCRDNAAAFCQRHGIEAAPERVRMIAITEVLQVRDYTAAAA
jgi:hypothetical protein